MILLCEQLLERIVPSLFTGDGYTADYHPIPGWSGQVYVTTTDTDDVFAADAGGSMRVVAHDARSGDITLDVIVQDPEFRGGVGDITTAGGMIVVAPGSGGGPVASVIDPHTGAVTNHLLPYSPDFRGGIKVGGVVDLNGDGFTDALFLPGEGGGPQLVGMDVRTGLTLASIWVGPPTDVSGLYQFVQAGTDVQLAPDMLQNHNHQGLFIQYNNDPLTTVAYGFDGTRY